MWLCLNATLPSRLLIKTSIRATGLTPDSGSEECADTPVTVSLTSLPSTLALTWKSPPLRLANSSPAFCRLAASSAGLSVTSVATDADGIWLVARPPVIEMISAPLPSPLRLAKLAMTVP
ncbi:hypothetical protein D3C78_1374200 [compost metagenome]